MAFVEETGNSGNAAASGSGHGSSTVGGASPAAVESSTANESKGKEAQAHPSPAMNVEHQGTQPENLLPGFGMQSPHAHGRTDRSYGYAKMHPTDREGKQLDPEGRFWKVYIDESENYDSDMALGLRNTIDATLIFAALFSSVVTGFVTESSQKLEPDYAQINVLLLVENNLLLRAGGNETKIEAVPQSSLRADSVTHSPEDVWVAWMFFTSLSLALVAALLSILVKQWLQAYTTIIPGDAKERCLIRQLRFLGLKKWKVSEIINFLPLFLHVSLALFLVGLGLFVRDFDLAIRIIVDVIAGGSFAFYLTAATLAAIYADCPYRIPILNNPPRFVTHLLRRLQPANRRHTHQPFSPSSLFREQELVLTLKRRFEALCIDWLFNESTNASVQQVSFDYATQFVEQFTGSDLWYLEPGKQYLHQIAQLLPLTELCSFALHLADTLPPSFKDASPAIRFLATCSSWSPQSLPPEAWHPALDSLQLLNVFLRNQVPIDVKYSRQDEMGYPLQHASYNGNWDAAKLLIPRSLPSHLSPFGPWGSPLMHACAARSLPAEKRLEIVSLLLTQGSNIGDVDNEGQNALHWTVSSPPASTKVLEMLLSSDRNLPPRITILRWTMISRCSKHLWMQ